MDLDKIFEALIASDKAARDSSPFNALQGTVDQLPGLIAGQSQNYDLKELLPAALGAGLLQGITGRVQDSYADRQNEMARDLYQSVIAGRGFSRPDSMAPSVFNTIRNASEAYRADKINTIEALQQKRKDDLADHISQKMVDSAIEHPSRVSSPQILKRALGIQDNEPQSIVDNDNSGTGVSTIAKPGNKTFEQYLAENDDDPTVAKMQMERDITEPDRRFTKIKEIANNFASSPDVQKFDLIDTGYRSLQEAIKDPHATSDIEIIRGVIQAVEPGLAVRGDDTAAVQESTSFTGAMKAKMLRALNGESGLDGPTRAGLMRIADRRYKENARKFTLARDNAVSLIQKYGGVPEDLGYLATYSPADIPTRDVSTAPSEALNLASKFPNTPEGRAAFKAQYAVQQAKEGGIIP